MKNWAWCFALVLAPFSPLGRAQTVLSSTNQLLGIDDGAITPDGRYAVVRQNTIDVSARIYDMSTGQFVAEQRAAQTSWWTGAAQDAVELTNTRAVVLGNRALVLDLTNPQAPPLGDHLVGLEARDVAITPSGDLAVIRGGNSVTGSPGGLFVVDLNSGVMLATHPGEIGASTASQHTYSVDSVVANDRYGVCLSLVNNSGEYRTRVTIWDLRPAAGGVPVVAYETTAAVTPEQDQFGAPHDVTLTPDGRFAAVRSEFSVSLYDLSGATPSRAWHQRLIGNPGAMGFTSMDSVEASNTLIATASRWTDGTSFATQVNVFDLAGNQWHARPDGDPHDLALTPNGSKLLVRTHIALYLYDLAALPPLPAQFTHVDRHVTTSTNTFFGAGYDSVEVTDELVVAGARNGQSTRLKVFDIRGGTLALKLFETMPGMLVDIAISPDSEWLAVSGTKLVQVYDLVTFRLVKQHVPVNFGSNLFPWCDGVEINNGRLLAWGWWESQNGWVSILSLFPEAQNYCVGGVNSTGAGAHLNANGSNSIAANDLQIWCTSLPANTTGYMVYGAGQNNVPFGNGTLCTAGPRNFMPVQQVTGGLVQRLFDYNGPNSAGGAITAGSTWNFQFLYRDPAGGGAQFNLSNGLTIPFVN